MNACPAAASSSVDRATAGLEWLGELFSAPDEYPLAARDLVAVLFGDGAPSAAESLDPTDAPNHGVSFEYSIALRGHESEVRLFLRPRSPCKKPTAASSWERGWGALRALEKHDLAWLASADSVANVFTPASDEAAFGLCLGAALRPRQDALIKIYFDAVARGIDSAWRTVREALVRLGHAAAWEWLETTAGVNSRELVPIFSLDLAKKDHARAKIYTSVRSPTVAKIESRAARIPRYREGSASAFCAAILGNDRDFSAGRTRPLLCWNMTTLRHDYPDDLTLHVPFNRYAHSAASASARLKRILPTEDFDRVERFLSRSHAAPSHFDRNPFHWVATKLNAETATTSLYVSADNLAYFQGVSPATRQ